MDLNRLRTYMHEANVDAVVASSPENVHHTSSSYIYTVLLVRDRMAFTIIPAEGECTYIVEANEKSQAELHSSIEDIQTYTEFVDYPVDTVTRCLKEKGLTGKRIAVERTHLPSKCEEHLFETVPGIEIVDAKSLLDRVRMIKTTEEIELLRRTATATRKALESAFMAARPGDTEKQVANHIARNILEMGADFLPFISVKTGNEFVIGHHLPGDTKLEVGNLIWCDYGAIWNGYFSDLARTWAIGEPTAVQKENYRKLSQIYREIIRNVTVGTRVSRLYEICKEGYEATGVQLTMPHIGHSIGVELHEFPMISPTDEYIIQENMVFNIEPGYSANGQTIHVEDLVLATKGGPEVLTGVLAPEEIPVVR